MKLADVQSCFAEALLTGNYDAVADLVYGDPLPPASVADAQAWRAIEMRLDLYRESVFASLTAVLNDSFPDLAAGYGEEIFQAAARAFIEAHPPAGPLLEEYGEEFPALLSAYAATRSTSPPASAGTLRSSSDE